MMKKGMYRKSRSTAVALAWLWAGSTAMAQQDSTLDAIRLQLVPVSHTILSSEIGGRVATLNVKEGDTFRKGAQLLALDCKLHEARLAKAEAQASEAAKVEAVNTELDKLGTISKLEFEVAGARLAAAEADATLMRSIVERCRITAPFAGKVARLAVQPFQFVGEGKELMEILDDSTLEFELFVPSFWLPSLAPQQKFSLTIDETSRSYPAVIERIAPSVDAVSQTVKVYGRIDGQFAELRAGMSGTAALGAP